MTGAQYAALLGLWVAGIVIPGPDIFVILRNAFLSGRRNALFTAVGVMVGNATWITLSLLGVTVLIGSNHVLKLVVQIGGALFLARMGYGSLRGGLAERAARRGGSPRSGAAASETSEASAASGAAGGHGTAGVASGTPEAPGPAGTSSVSSWDADDAARGPAGRSVTESALAEDPALAEDVALEHEVDEVLGRDRGLLGTAGLTPWRAVVQGTVTNLANAKAVVFFVALFGSVVPTGIAWWEMLSALGMLVGVGLVWFLAVAWAGSVPALASRFRAHTAEVEIVSGVVFLLVALGLLVEGVLAF